MEKRTFNEIISRAIAKGATKVEISRSKCICGCVKPNDITEVIVYRDDIRKEGDVNYCCIRFALTNVFDAPKIKVEALWRNIKTNACFESLDIKEYEYAI